MMISTFTLCGLYRELKHFEPGSQYLKEVHDELKHRRETEQLLSHRDTFGEYLARYEIEIWDLDL